MHSNLAEQIEYGPLKARTKADDIRSGSKATSGPVQLIVSPGVGRQIVLDSIVLQAEADGDNLILLANTAGTVVQRLFVTLKSQGIARSNVGWCLGANLGLTLTTSANLAMGYTIHFHYEDV